MLRTLMAACIAIVLYCEDIAAADNLLLESEIVRLAEQMSDGFSEYVEGSITTLECDPPACKRDSVLVLFSVEGEGGGNGYKQYLAVFSKNEQLYDVPARYRFRPYKLNAFLQVGQDYERWFGTLEIKQKLVVLSGARWTAKDAHCCPSGKSTTRYRLGEYEIREVQ